MAVIPFRRRQDPWSFEPTRSAATLSSRIVEEVTAALFEKRLAPGDFLGTEKDIAEQAGASRIVARDALRTLQALGVVEIKVGAGGGARIAQGNPRLFSQALAVISASVVILTAGYILWAIQRVYLGPEYKGPHPEALTPMTLREFSIAAPLLALAIFFGVYPQALLNYMQPSVDKTVVELTDYRDPLDECDQDSARGEVRRVLNSLPGHYARILELRFGDELSGREIACTLQMSEDAAESLLARARQAFKSAWTVSLQESAS